MLDVLIAGGGPAGAISALILARAGVRVVVIGRPGQARHASDSGVLLPAARDVLATLALSDQPWLTAPAFTGTVVSAFGARLADPVGAGDTAVVVSRAAICRSLLDAAVRAGARYEPGWRVRHPLVDDRRGLVRGWKLIRPESRHSLRLPAVTTLGADGRHSAVAGQLGLRGRARPRRWALVARLTGARPHVREVHLRTGWYAAVEPSPSGDEGRLWVVPPARPWQASAAELLQRLVNEDADLRVHGQSLVASAVQVHAPVSTRVAVPGVPGVLLAGDAAGRLDPITGDGLTLALIGGELAAVELMRVLADGRFQLAPWRLLTARRSRFRERWNANRWAVRATHAPDVVRQVTRWTGLFPAFARRVAMSGQL